MQAFLIPLDKSNHAIYGAVIALVVFVVALHYYPLPLAATAAMGASVAVGVLKEAYDRYANIRAGRPVHGVEFLDALATALGGAAISAAAMLPTVINT